MKPEYSDEEDTSEADDGLSDMEFDDDSEPSSGIMTFSGGAKPGRDGINEELAVG